MDADLSFGTFCVIKFNIRNFVMRILNRIGEKLYSLQVWYDSVRRHSVSNESAKIL